jgi:hypothetical protein
MVIDNYGQEFLRITSCATIENSFLLFVITIFQNRSQLVLGWAAVVT